MPGFELLCKSGFVIKVPDFKKEEMGIMKQICLTQKTDELMPQLEAIRAKATNTFNELLNL